MTATTVREELHFTGGFRACRAGKNWMLLPFQRGATLASIGPIPDEQVGPVSVQLGISVFGADQISDANPNLQTRIWTPLLGVPRFRYQPDDSWAMIGHAAKSSGDDRYGSLAKHLAMSLRAAGVSIRDASDRYHVQLKAALLSGQRPGLRFTNIPLLDDLHSAFHFLLAELSSARDYLAAIAALGVGAPENVDALSRLVKWLSNSKSGSALADPLIAAFLDNEAQVWLGEITDYRNQFLHRKPLGADESARWLRLRQHDSPM